MEWQVDKLGGYSKASRKRPNVLAPMTQEEWDGLSGKAQWDSKVALRGPDFVGSSNIKWFTTGVIRHRLSKVMRTGGVTNGSLPFVVIPVGDAIHSSPHGTFDEEHFVGHIREAAMWLGIPICYCSSEVWNLIKTDRSYTKVIQALLEDSQVDSSTKEVLKCLV